MRSNDEIMDLLTQLKNEQGLSISEIARRVDMAKSAVSRYYNRTREFPLNRADDFAKVFGISTEYLLGVNATKETYDTFLSILKKLKPERQSKVLKYAESQLVDQEKPKVTSLADYHRIEETHEIYLQSKVSAGTGILDLDSEYKEEITYTGKLPQYYDMAFAVAGDSMRPVFEDGEIIFVEKMDSPINGAIMVVQIDEEAFVKKVYIEENDLRLVSLNKHYKDIYADSRNDIRIVGKVVM